MKTFSERNPLIIGAARYRRHVGARARRAELPESCRSRPDSTYSAYFAEAGGLLAGDAVQVSGFGSARCRASTSTAPGAGQVQGRQATSELGDRTEAAIKTKSLLGTKILEITPRGDGQLSGPIPLERTTSPYQLPDALGDLTTTISGLNTDQLSHSLARAGRRRSPTPSRTCKRAVQGVARFSRPWTSATRNCATAGQRQQSDRRAGRTQRRSGQSRRRIPTLCWSS